MAAPALFVFVVAVASAAFFFVGIVAFRSVGAAAFAAVVLVGIELSAVFPVGAALAEGVPARLLTAGLDVAVGAAPLLEAARAADADALAAVVLTAAFGDTVPFDGAAVELPAALPFAAFGGLLAAWLPRAAAGLAAVALVARVALVRFTDAAGCAAVRAAALDAAAGLAVRDGALLTLFAAPVLADVAPADAFAAVDWLGAGLVAPDFAALGLVEAATGLRTTAFAALRSRATGLVLGDMRATPEIGRSPEA